MAIASGVRPVAGLVDHVIMIGKDAPLSQPLDTPGGVTCLVSRILATHEHQ
jgi:hypothetical protein